MSSRIIRGFISVAGARIGAIAVTMIITPLLVRTLGSDQYGEYAVVTSFLGMTIIIINAGMFDGLRKFLSENPESEIWRNSIFGFYFRYSAAITAGGVIIILFAVALGLPQSIFGAHFGLYFVLGAVILTGRQFFQLSRSALMGLNLEHLSEPLRVVSHVIFGIVALALVSFGFGVEGVLLGRIVALLSIVTIGLYFVKSSICLSSVATHFSLDIPRRNLISFSAYSVVFAFLTESLYHTDILLLQPMVGSSSTGYYKAALIVSEFLWFAPVSIQTVFLHATSRMWEEGKQEQISELASRAARYTLLLSLLLSIGLAALSEEFISLYYGSEFQPSIMPLLLLLPGTIGFSVARPIFAIGQGKGALRILIGATGAAAVINLALNLILIPEFGMRGAAVATSIGYGSMLFFHIYAARRIGFDPLSDLRLFRVLLTAGVALPLIFGIASYISSNIISLFIVPFFGLLVFTTLSITFGAVTKSEISALWSNFDI
ncbi:oligosaccharide flippase family protein [Haladaptatus sp. NG-SE-30]